MDVGVAEAGEDAPPAEVDTVRAGQRGLVGADPACDAFACDRQGAAVWTTMTTLVILLLLVVMLAIASYWPTSD